MPLFLGQAAIDDQRTPDMVVKTPAMLVERMILRSFGAGETNAFACSAAGSFAQRGKTGTWSLVRRLVVRSPCQTLRSRTWALLGIIFSRSGRCARIEAASDSISFQPVGTERGTFM